MKVTFSAYMEYDETESLARVILEEEVPLNISLLPGSDRDLREGEACEVSLWTNDYEISVYDSEEEYSREEPHFAALSMIPVGTFLPGPEQKDFRQSAAILFSGIVREAEHNPDPQEGAPNWRLAVETYGMDFDLFSYDEEAPGPGSILHGHAWIYGRLKRAE